MTITLSFVILTFVFAVPDKFGELLWRDSSRRGTSLSIVVNPPLIDAASRRANCQKPSARADEKNLQVEDGTSIIRRMRGDTRFS
jgi:hypothetical protein